MPLTHVSPILCRVTLRIIFILFPEHNYAINFIMYIFMFNTIWQVKKMFNLICYAPVVVKYLRCCPKIIFMLINTFFVKT